MIKSFFTYTPEEEAQRQALLDRLKASLDAFDAVRKSADSPERTAALNAARSESAQLSQEQARLHFTAQKRYIADMSANPDLALEHVSEIVQAYTKEDIIKQISQVKRLNDPYEAQLKDLLSDDNIVLSEEFQKSYKKELARIRRINATICRKNYASAVYWLKFTCFEELDALKEHPDHAARAEKLITTAAAKLFPQTTAVELDNYNAQQLTIDGFFEDPYIKIAQGVPNIMLLSVNTRGTRQGMVSGSLTLKLGKNREIVLQNFRDLIGEFGTSTNKIFTASCAKLADINSHKADPLRIENRIRIPLLDYAKLCGEDVEPRHCETLAEMEADKARIKKILDNFCDQLRQDGDLLMSALLSYEDGSQKFDRIRLISRFAIRGGYIIINFDSDMARYLLNAYIQFVPTAIWKLSNKNPNSFSLAMKLVFHNGLDSNVLHGTNTRLKVKNLISSMPKLQSYEEMKATGNRNWKARIKTPFEKCMQEFLDCGVLSRWAYYNGDNELTSDQAGKLKYDDWANLVVEFALKPDPPDQSPRLAAKAERIAAAEKPEKKKRGRPRKNVTGEK